MSEQRYPKRLIEVDLPVREISTHARREKSIRRGHISTLHIWWARKPIGAMRAIICATLWPDPADPLCPTEFVSGIQKPLSEFIDAVFAERRVYELSMRSISFWDRLRTDKDWKPLKLQEALIRFLADFSNWDAGEAMAFTRMARAINALAKSSLDDGSPPIVADPFAGGGSIPLVALAIGATSFASDINPVAIVQNKLLIEFIPACGDMLANEIRKWGRWIREQAERTLATLYPSESDGTIPLAYLWARQIRCEGPACGASFPLLPNNWIVRKPEKKLIVRAPASQGSPFALAVPKNNSEVRTYVKLGKAVCPFCGFTTPNQRVRAQLVVKRGGASDAMLLAVVRTGGSSTGRSYRAPTTGDVEAAQKANEALAEVLRKNPNAIPTEPIPFEKMWRNNPIRVNLYGMTEWRDLQTPRQSVVLAKFAELVRNLPVETTTMGIATKTALALAVDRLANTLTSVSRWHKTRETLEGLFSRPAINMMWDFAEGFPFSGASGDWDGAVEWVAEVCESNGTALSGVSPGQAEWASATQNPLPDDCVDAVITDPPYYDAIPYGTISDYFYVWLKRTIGMSFPELFKWQLIPKTDECAVDDAKGKDKAFFANTMTKAMEECRRILRPNGTTVVIFANTSTEAWETQLSSMIEAGLTITASWPVDTEMAARLRARDSAALASSICLVARPRACSDGIVVSNRIGDWRSVLEELPRRIHDWMPRLAQEGVVGADAIFACLGPALEIFSRYSRVEKANGDEVKLREYLEQVWAAVAREALSTVLKDADSNALDPDARLTVIWLWTLGGGQDTGADTESQEDDDDDDDESPTTSTGSGFMLEYDAARKIAQGLGARLEELTQVVEVKGEKARLLPVTERARYLFGKAEHLTTSRKPLKKPQLSLFADVEQAETAASWEEIGPPRSAITTLDRIHQAMLLFGTGRSEALKRLLVEEGVGHQATFWKLSQSLSALYPAGSEEKRWVDGVLARKKGLGFG